MTYSSGFSNPFGFTVTPWVKRLLIANVAAFLLLLPFGGLIEYVAFRPSTLLTRPWTPVTYMFVHLGVFHLLFNMLSLFFFGPPLEERWGSRAFAKFYAIAGLGGALAYVVVGLVGAIFMVPFPGATIAGASGAVFGVMVAFAMLWPDNPIYIWGIFPVKARWLVAFLVGLNVFYGISGGGGNTAYLAHLGGALTAFLYLRSPYAPSAWGEVAGRSRKPAGRSGLLAKLSTARRRVKAVESAPAPRPAAPPKARRRPPVDDVDRILEKISEDGISSLTADERRQLEEASRKFRTN